MSIDSALAHVHHSVPGCVACGLIDLRAQQMLGIRTTSDPSSGIVDLLALAATEVLASTDVADVESMFKSVQGRPANDRRYFREVIVLSDDLLYVFHRFEREDHVVLVTVCRVSRNLHETLAKSRGSLSAVEAAI